MHVALRGGELLLAGLQPALCLALRGPRLIHAAHRVVALAASSGGGGWGEAGARGEGGGRG